MNTSTSSTVVGVFEDKTPRQQSYHRASPSRVQSEPNRRSYATRRRCRYIISATEHDSQAASGALTGALTGLGLGALAGLGVLAGVIPVVGPAIAAGTLGVILSNAAAGAGVVGLVGALVGSGIPEHEAKYYQGELESGRSIITVNAAGRNDEAIAILRRCGGYDMSSRAADFSPLAVIAIPNSTPGMMERPLFR